MDTTKTTTIERQTITDPFPSTDDGNELTKERLDTLLSVNAEYARKEEIFKSDLEEFEADLMSNPVSIEKAFSQFGLLLGTFPPAAFFTKFMLEGNFRTEDLWVIALLLLVNTATAFAGYFSGKLIGKITFELEKLDWHWMILALPFIGLFWGIITGAAGGVFILVIGAIFGAMLGGIVGSVALPAFAIFHRLYKRGDKIDKKHFLPIAFGISFIISAFILGM